MSVDIKVSQNLQALAHGIDDAITNVAGEKVGFALVVFTPSRAQYVSNCDRAEVVAGLKELLEFWGRGLPDIHAHDICG